MKDRVLLWCWVIVIFVIVVPWGTFQPHSHWGKIAWLPFVTGPFRLRDIVLNTLLYVPFGYWLTTVTRARWWQTIGVAVLLSAATELTQVFAHSRYPTATDVTCNTAGAIWGTRWARQRK